MTNKIKTLGQLKKSGYIPKTIKQELRDNLIAKLQKGEKIFDGIIGYDQTVIPDVERAILSQHNILLLGLRGQAKTRMARLMVNLLDEYVPVLADSEINEDPMLVISNQGKELIAKDGDKTPIAWLHKSQRYAEKLATPDVSVADLIGDIDPIKAANNKYSFSDERVLHFGMVPRSNRNIFVINELPDLQARIQVALFNILEEGDIQIRGFKLRLPLDIQFVFTANPEDYTNRGSIVTPLKDRIQSQILTHYPASIEEAKAITTQEANVLDDAGKVHVPELAKDLIEAIAFEARDSEFVDQNSGVSARMTITAFENLISAAQRRMLINKEKKSSIRMTDFWGIIPAITGKMELVYEGEQEGPIIVAHNLLGKAIRRLFKDYFPEPKSKKERGSEQSKYINTLEHFSLNSIEFKTGDNNKDYESLLKSVPGLDKLVAKHQPKSDAKDQQFLMEFVLHGLAEHSLISKHVADQRIKFNDLMSQMFQITDDELEEDDY